MHKGPLSIAFAPNFEADDARLATRLLMGDRKESATAPEGVKKWFEHYTGGAHPFLFSSGRAALYYALESLGIEKKSEVLLQAFTCVAVPNAVLWAGFHPVYVDIDKKTFNMDMNDLRQKITSNTRVILAQHTFGNPAPMREIMMIAKKHSLVVIEDCAHALGASDQGRMVGTQADVAIFSFGRDKVVSSVFGGVATTKNAAIAHRLAVAEQLLSNPPISFVTKQLFYPLLYAFAKPLYSSGLGKALLRLCATTHLLTPAVFSTEKKGLRPQFIDFAFSPLLCTLALHQLEKLDRFNQHRRKIAALYASHFKKKLVRGSAHLRFALLVQNKEAILKGAKKRGLHLGDWYKTPLYPAESLRSFSYALGACKSTEEVCNTIINLPTHIGISLADAQKVCDEVSMLIHESKTNRKTR